MSRYFLLLFLLPLWALPSAAQISGKVSLANSTLASTEEDLPFWLWANTDGKIAKDNSFLNLSELEASGSYLFNASRSFISFGTSLQAGFANENYFQANQLFAKLNMNNWELNVGLYPDDLQFGGLSSSNGNLAKSRNARPYPRIGIRISDYKPVPFFGEKVWFKGEYNEGLLLDDRYVDKTHLHHKSFYLKLQLTNTFNLQAGLEHFAMWGGTSRNKEIGRLPDNLNAYWKYIRGANGGEDFPETDQLNVAGNSYGTYQILLTKQFNNMEAGINISHPFEDYSGINWRNWPDNLIGLHLKFGQENALISEILYEFTNTRQQGITDSLYRWEEDEQRWRRIHDDNYFNHGTYHSGVTHYGQTMVSPLFYPVKTKGGISTGVESNRFFAHHVGAKGNLGPVLKWKGLLTYVKHFGTYAVPLSPNKKYAFALLELLYNNEKLPFTTGFSLAADLSNSISDKTGFRIKLSKEW